LFFLGLVALVALFMSNLIRAYSNYLLIKFAQMQTHYLGYRILKNYLFKPYEFFLTQNSSDLTKLALSEVNQLVGNVFLPLLRSFGRFFSALFILLLIVSINPKVAIAMTLILGGAYSLVFLFFKRKIADLGKVRTIANSLQFKVISEASGGIKEVKLMSKEETYLASFRKPSLEFAHGQTHNAIVGELPKYLLEVIAFGGILSVVLYLIATEGESKAISLASLYALAGYKLMPSLQEIYNSLTKVKFNRPILTAVSKSLDGEEASNSLTFEKRELFFTNEIKLENISFSYSGSAKKAISNVSFSVPILSTVGIVGSTGSGKTTLVDIILGLLTPNEGHILVDGETIDQSNLSSWQSLIGYVPQVIYLSDDTIEANIAFGVPKDQIDHEMVKTAAKLAQIDSFIENNLPEKYLTQVGERGIRLSGGQRQRIGVARALYRNPSLIVFDEATSALDNETEKALMESIESLSGSKTIVMIAHRLSTLEKADRIIHIENGVLKNITDKN
ncbi:MAG: ABC transporter ATP-binding protein, partial [Bacteriovoracaceae bacterium]